MGPTALAGPAAPNAGDLDLGGDPDQDLQTNAAGAGATRGRGDKGHEDQKPRSNIAAPTSGAPIARIGPNMQITKKGNSCVVTETGNTISASTSGPGTSTGDQGSG